MRPTLSIIGFICYIIGMISASTSPVLRDKIKKSRTLSSQEGVSWTSKLTHDGSSFRNKRITLITLKLFVSSESFSKKDREQSNQKRRNISPYHQKVQ
jgi:hypothetical protein